MQGSFWVWARPMREGVPGSGMWVISLFILFSIRSSRMLLFMNPLPPGDIICCHRTWSTLAQVMAWCPGTWSVFAYMMALCPATPNHYLNQCWLIIISILVTNGLTIGVLNMEYGFWAMSIPWLLIPRWCLSRITTLLAISEWNPLWCFLYL